MNLSAYLSGCWQALRPEGEWRAHIPLTSRGLLESYAALVLTLPAYYICALAIAAHRGRLLESGPLVVPPAPFAAVALFYALSFSASIYIICLAFGKRMQFNAWVILRHWSLFFCALFIASLFGLYLVGFLPFMAANFMAFAAYLVTLAIDIRLAQRIGQFDLTAAIFTGCIIKAMELSVLLIGIVQIGGAL